MRTRGFTAFMLRAIQPPAAGRSVLRAARNVRRAAAAASQFTMFGAALVPPLWRQLMDRRLDAIAEAQRAGRHEPQDWVRAEHCR